jgi:hypothetical protein
MDKPKRPKKMWNKDRNGMLVPSLAHIRYVWELKAWEYERKLALLTQMIREGRRMKFNVRPRYVRLPSEP